MSHTLTHTHVCVRHGLCICVCVWLLMDQDNAPAVTCTSKAEVPPGLLRDSGRGAGFLLVELFSAPSPSSACRPPPPCLDGGGGLEEEEEDDDDDDAALPGVPGIAPVAFWPRLASPRLAFAAARRRATPHAPPSRPAGRGGTMPGFIWLKCTRI